MAETNLPPNQVQCRTPARTIAQLTPDPGNPPAGYVLMNDNPVVADAKSGDMIGIDRRWCSVTRSTGLNGWVSVDTVPYCPNVTAFWDTPVFLARRV